MSWLGTMRQINAACNRIERAERRRQRELEKQSKLQAKMQEQDRASYEAQLFDNRISLLLSVHKECGNVWDWSEIQSTPLPAGPMRSNENEMKAQGELDSFKVGIKDRLMGKGELKRTELIKAVDTAKARDEMNYQMLLSAHKQKASEIEKLREVAKKILDGDRQSYLDAIAEVQPFRDIAELGSSIDFNIDSAALIKATLHVHGDQLVPTEIKTVTKSGKLSIKPMPKNKFFDLYQDYVCGSAFRVARELFALLPVETVVVTVMGDLLNSQTGHMEEKPILSVAMPKSTMKKLNFDNLDPSDALSNFIHNMAFKKGKGFSAVESVGLT